MGRLAGSGSGWDSGVGGLGHIPGELQMPVWLDCSRTHADCLASTLHTQHAQRLVVLLSVSAHVGWRSMMFEYVVRWQYAQVLPGSICQTMQFLSAQQLCAQLCASRAASSCCRLRHAPA